MHIKAAMFCVSTVHFPCYVIVSLLFLIPSCTLVAQPTYRFSTNGDEFLRLAFPTPTIPVHFSRAFLERTNPFIPGTHDEVLIQNMASSDPMNVTGWFRVPDDITESYWLSLLAGTTNCVSLISTSLLGEENTSSIIAVCSNLLSEDLRFESVFEKALFQRDAFQLYYVFVNCTNYASTLNENAKNRRGRTVAVLRQLLKKLRLEQNEYRDLTNAFTRTLEANATAQDAVFEISRRYLPLREALALSGWCEMRFAAIENKHFIFYGGRSFVRYFAQPADWSRERFYSYWDEVQQKFGDHVHLNSSVPAIPPKTQFMLVRTFAVLLRDGTIADSGVPEEVLIRAFKTSKRQLDLKSSDYRGAYFYVYKMSRRLLLNTPVSLGLLRHLEDYPTFYGFYSDVPDLRIGHGPALVTTRYNCIDCHSLLFYGSSTVFSLGRARLKNPAYDQFSGSLLRAVFNRPSRYVFGVFNENLALE